MRKKKTKPASKPEEKKFAERCYALLKQVPPGKVTTYKELAQALGGKAYRAVGAVLNKNPYAPVVPCHRVVMSDGQLGGFAKGVRAKIKLLEQENILIADGKIADFGAKLFTFKR